MTKEETLDLMHKIKAHYQEFALEDYVISEWYEKLKLFDYEDVLKTFENHLTGEYQSKIPKLHYIANGLKTPEEKAKASVIHVKCSLCGRSINYLDFDSHLARHSSVYYIKSREHYLGQHYNEEQMLNAEQEYFDKFYDKFLEKLFLKIENGDEKERLRKILTCINSPILNEGGI